MRLVCPNCDAQYEVDAAAIPEAGRDVQCSSCGHAWFQAHPQVEADRQLDEEVFARDALEAMNAPMIDVVSGTEKAVPPEIVEAMPDSLAGAAAAAEPETVASGAGMPRRKVLDDTVLAVLREEAEREAAVRLTDAPRGVEVQPELGLQPPPVVTAATAAAVPASVLAARERFKDLSSDTADLAEDEVGADARPAHRRELLPDIEEINSTLRASGEPRGEGDEAALPPAFEDRRKGFRSGFVLMIVIAVALWFAYTMSPRIVAQMPASAPAMQAYVAAVNTARIKVDSALQSASKSLRNLSGQDR